MQDRRWKSLSAAAALLALAACGSGGGQTLASAGPMPGPTPTPTPTSTPTPTPTTAFTPRPATIFAAPPDNPNIVTVGKGWQFESDGSSTAKNVRDAGSLSITYDAASGHYLVAAPIVGSGTLMQLSEPRDYPYPQTISADPSDRQSNSYSGPSMQIAAAGQPSSKYSYVSFVDFFAQEPAQAGLQTVVYGNYAVAQPTRAGDVPVTGSATYIGDLTGTLRGDAFGSWITGSARFDFDFARATLKGDLSARLQCLMGCSSQPLTYSLVNTSFMLGATTFSGQIAAPDAPRLGSFSGMFAGPKAAELVSTFEMPFYSIETGTWVDARGVIAGKR